MIKGNEKKEHFYHKEIIIFIMDITQLKNGEKGKIVEIQGKGGVGSKLEAMGIRVGVEIIKLGSQMMGGPITIQVGNTKVAIGYGMAHKVIVEPLER